MAGMGTVPPKTVASQYTSWCRPFLFVFARQRRYSYLSHFCDAFFLEPFVNIPVLVVSQDQAAAAALGHALGQDLSGPRLECHSSACADALDRAAMRPPKVVIYQPQHMELDSAVVTNLGRATPGLRILLRLQVSGPETVLLALHWGACGYLEPLADIAMVAKAVRRVSEGDMWFGRGDLLEALRRRGGKPAAIKVIPASEKLTAREEEVLELIGAGLSNKEIGRRLKISDNTVKTHLHRVYVKLNKSGRYKALLAQGFAAGRVKNDVSSPPHADLNGVRLLPAQNCVF